MNTTRQSLFQAREAAEGGRLGSDNNDEPIPSAASKANETSLSKYGQIAQDIKQSAAENLQKRQLDALANVTSFDWKAIPPPMLAQVIINMPFKGATGEPDYYLQPWQALVFAMRCFELGLSPFSNEVWFNPKNNKVNVTFEGKLKLARANGLNLSPPIFERIPADGTKPLAAFKCTIMAPHGKCEYTATLKEWNVPKSPVWREKPEHMLQLRAAEKCLSFATGTGASELPHEADLQEGSETRRVMEPISATEFVANPEDVPTRGDRYGSGE